MFVCMYACMYVCIYVCMHVCMHVCTLLHVLCMCVYVLCVGVYIYGHVHCNYVVFFNQVTQCEIFLSMLVRFLDSDKPLWQRTLAVEVLHLFTNDSSLLRYINIIIIIILLYILIDLLLSVMTCNNIRLKYLEI